MAPSNQKRKRADFTHPDDSNDGSNRPSPHRPQNLGHAQQNPHNNQNARGGRMSNRQIRGDRSVSKSPISGPSNTQSMPSQASTTNPSNTMSPPPVPPKSSRAASSTKPEASAVVLNESASALPVPAPAVKPLSPDEYDYQYVTKERTANWSASGRKAIIQDACHARDKQDTMTLSVIFQELVHSAFCGLRDPTDNGNVIREIVGDATSESDGPAILFLDCVAIMTEEDVKRKELPPLIFATGISPDLMRMRLDSSLLVALGLVRGIFSSQQVRTQTGVYYKQGNYNLLREESEGYAKIMDEYFTTVFSAEPTAKLVHDTFTKILGMIGAFDLDVGRVLDVTLDVFANLLVKHYRFFIKFLVASSWWPNNKSFDGIETPDYPHKNLPPWALPNSVSYSLTEADKDRLALEREDRDIKFWDRVRETGMKAYFELGGREVIDEGSAARLQAKLEKDIKDFEENQKRISEEAAARGKKAPVKETPRDFSREWLAGTQTLPPRGNFEAAQLLGFKLRFYSSEARDPEDTFPENLIYLAALLIKIGFISLKDLYPHLYPLDSAMDTVQKRKMQEKAERQKGSSGGAENALTRAAPLVDEEAPTTTASRLRGTASRATPKSSEPASPSAIGEETKKPDLPEPADQKVLLLKSLLTIGALPESLCILGRFPWLIDAFPDILAHIHRILHHSLSKLCDESKPFSGPDSIRKSQQIAVESTGVSTGELKTTEMPKRRIVRWAQPDKIDSGDVDYRYYWESWTDDVPVCQTVDDLFSLCSTFLNLSGVKIGLDTSLLLKLVRIATKSLIDDSSTKNRTRWMDLTKRILLPALSFVKSNSGVVNEVWDVLKNFPQGIRFNMYAEWYTGATSRIPEIQEAFSETKLETMRVMKRVTKDNVRQMARTLAKPAYSSPGIVFQVAFSQMESYESLITNVVDCGQYFTDLAYDILTWSLLNTIGGGIRSRVQPDGMFTSSWLKAVSIFSGEIFKTYAKMDVIPVLRYVAHRLRTRHPTELEVVEQIVWSSAGIATDVTFSENETVAMGGGPTLRAQTLISLGDQRHDKHRQEPSKRLIESLKTSGLASELLIAMVQERQTYEFQESTSKMALRVVASNLDKIHRVNVQYLEMLRALLNVADFDETIPGVASLISDFGLEPGLAFEIARPSLATKIMEVDAAIKAERQQKKARRNTDEKANPNGDVEMGEDTSSMPPSSSSGIIQSSPAKAEDSKKEGEEREEDTPMNDALSSSDQHQTLKSSLAVVGDNEPWHPVLKPVIGELRSLIRSKFETTSSLAFYVTFWQLGIYDLHVPTKSYQEEMNRVQERTKTVKADRSDISAKGVQEKDRKLKELVDMHDKLSQEMKAHVDFYTQTRHRLGREKDHWFSGLGNTRQSLDSLNINLLQECFLPRMILSPLDAQYTFKMIFFLHSSGTPGFRTMFLLDSIFNEKQLTGLIFKSTAFEAENMGRFLFELLRELGKWHADKSTYEKQAFGPKKDLPGFAIKITVEKGAETFREYEDFRRALYKWHRNLHNAIKSCFGSDEYMHIKNTLIILKAISTEFPAITYMGSAQLTSLSALSKDDRRPDLKVAASALTRNFKRRQDKWVMPQAFHINETTASVQQNSSQTPSAKPATPQPGTGQRDSGTAHPLNASAPEFKPTPPALANGASRKTSVPSKGDAEDGEIEDEKTAKATPNTTSDASNDAKEESSNKQRESDKKESKTVGEQKSTPKPSTPAPSDEQKQTTDSGPEKAQLNEPQKLPESAPPAANVSSRPPPTSTKPSRTPHQLPNRPEQPPRRPADRGPERSRDPQHGRRDGRSSQREDYGRLDRPADLGRSDMNGDAIRREASPGRRGHDRTPEHLAHPRYERADHMPPDARDRQGDYGPRPLARDSREPDNRPGSRAPSGYEASRERPSDHSRDFVPGKRPRPTPSSSMGPPASVSSQQPDNRGLAHPDRAVQIQQSQPPDRPSLNSSPLDGPRPADDRGGMNPERAARMGGDLHQDSRPRDMPRDRPTRQGEKDRRSSYEMDEYHHDRQSFEGPHPHSMPSNNRERREEIGPPPSGPRGGRRSERDLFEAGNAPRSSNDQHAGRLAQDYPPPRAPQDPNYGRLNSQSDVPSGPRGRSASASARGGHNFSTPQPSINTRLSNNESSMPSPMAQSPSQPRNQAPSRSYRDRNPSQFERPPPTTPGTAAQTPTADQGAASDLSGVHPSRLGRVQPSPIRTDMKSYPPQQPQHSPASTSGMHPPSGPRMQQPSPAQSNPSTESLSGGRSVPTGPSSGAATERQRNEARKFAGMQGVLQQAGSPSTQAPSSDRDSNAMGPRSGAPPSATTDRGGSVSIRGQASSRGGRGGHSQGSLHSAGTEGLPPRPPPSDMQNQRGELFPGRPQDDRDARRGGDDRRDDRVGPGRERPLPRSTLSREQSHERHAERGGRPGDERDARDLRDARKDPHRPGFERMPSDRDARDAGGRRGRDDGRDRPGPPGSVGAGGMPRAMEGGGRRPPPMMGEMDHGYGGGGGGGGWGGHPDARNGDARMRGPPGHMGPPGGGDGRRDDRDRGGRDSRKRPRGDDGMHGDSKRSRRSG